MIAGYIGMLTMQLRFIAGACIDIQRHLVNLELLLTYIYSAPQGFEMPGAPQQAAPDAVFTVVNLSSRIGGRTLFDDLSFVLHSGEALALTAPSGYGKSTLLHYLVGLGRPQSGVIRLNNITVSENISNDILSQISLVPQKPTLIPGTIRDNVLYGCAQDREDKMIITMLQRLELLNNNDGTTGLRFLAREVGRDGGGLSGGEIQRICIARALLRSPLAILLDEPTAALNEDLALRIIAYIRSQVPTVLLTTHNANVAAACDRHITLGSGNVHTARAVPEAG